MKTIYWLAFALVVIGALNWGLVGAFQVDLVAALLGGAQSSASRLVYVLVGLAGIIIATRAGAPRDVNTMPTARTTL